MSNGMIMMVVFFFLIMFKFWSKWTNSCYHFLSIIWFFGQNEGKDQSEEPERLGAIISNHVSYLDILYHMSASFPSFVAKVCSCSVSCIRFSLLEFTYADSISCGVIDLILV
jgi:1-acyl-sn-glycerol-3-phosphate acyltransferase